MSKTGALRPTDVKFYMAHLVHAVSFLHSQGIVHRDLKPDNVFMNENGHLVIGDFGLATTLALSADGSDLEENEPLFLRHTVSWCGSPAYMAPEIYANKWYGVSVDVWALGVMHYEMLTNTLPFKSEFTITELGRSILEDAVAYSAQVWEEDESAKAFSEALLNKNGYTRVDAGNAQVHAYLFEL